MENKFNIKPGDRIRFKNKRSANWSCSGLMDKYIGASVVVSRVRGDGKFHVRDIDNEEIEASWVFDQDDIDYVMHCADLPMSRSYIAEEAPARPERFAGQTGETEQDDINHPSHYCREGGMESIDEMLLIFGKEVVMNFCLCNVWKYRYRAGTKAGEDGGKDLAKSDWYMRKYKELTEGEKL